jgi:hypothetical protein
LKIKGLLNMTIREIENHANNDLPLKQDKLDIISSETPDLYNKYHKIFNTEAVLYKKLSLKKKVLYKDLYEYYSGRKSIEELKDMGRTPFNLKLLKTDINIYIESDKEMIELEEKLAIQSQKISYIEGILKQISNRQWVVKNIIEWQKFTNGII